MLLASTAAAERGKTVPKPESRPVFLDLAFRLKDQEVGAGTTEDFSFFSPGKHDITWLEAQERAQSSELEQKRS